MSRKLLSISLFTMVALAAAVPTHAAPRDDGREADRAAIREHIDKIFQAYIDKDRETVRKTHSQDWRGFLTGSRSIIRGIDEYMQTADGSLKNPNGGMSSYKITDCDIIFHGDVAVVNYVAEIEWRANNLSGPDKLRTLDVYEKRGGHWIQVASNTARHPDAIATQIATPAPITPEMRRLILSAREAVWRAWFANDRAKLEQMIPDEAVAINSGQGEWEDRAAILAGAQRFAESGARLVRLEFPRTDIQIYGNTVVLYTTYLFEIEVQGKRETTAGRGTEIFVRRGNTLVNTGWHLDEGK
jgi:Domain of unknown function (DUF4440)